ncbi:integrator complex subunit 6-like [Meriones unguiculatus]|uniref:integrator complex subunit 6-like n=1 Tax=Meriones unguiculatus TaxID=10047 RepID=UPI00293E62AD|nr:integrator complex subunit 6-like [Meriones unguiculatus]
MFKQKVSPAEEQEVMRPPKKRCTVNMMSNKSFEASDKAKGEGATVSQEAQVGTLPGSSNDYSQKCAQSQRKPVAGEAVLPSPEDSPPDHSLHRKDDDDVTVTGGSVSSAHSAGTVNAPVMPSAESGPSASLPSPNVTNHEIKCALMTEIRRYGRQYGKIFKILEEVPGPLEVRIQFVEFTIKEAARFKRHHLINYLEKILEKLMAERSLNNGDLHPSV